MKSVCDEIVSCTTLCHSGFLIFFRLVDFDDQLMDFFLFVVVTICVSFDSSLLSFRSDSLFPLLSMNMYCLMQVDVSYFETPLSVSEYEYCRTIVALSIDILERLSSCAEICPVLVENYSHRLWSLFVKVGNFGGWIFHIPFSRWDARQAGCAS